MGDVAEETKARIPYGIQPRRCRGYMNGKWIYLPREICQRIIVKEQRSAEVVVSWERAPIRHGEVSRTTEGRNGRMAKELRSL
jgi:hypothetical protein